MRPPLLLERIDPEVSRGGAQGDTVEGVVILQAIIGIDGRVEEIALVKSASPMLDDVGDSRRAGLALPAGDAERSAPCASTSTVTADFRLR